MLIQSLTAKTNEKLIQLYWFVHVCCSRSSVYSEKTEATKYQQESLFGVNLFHQHFHCHIFSVTVILFCVSTFTVNVGREKNICSNKNLFKAEHYWLY